MRRVSSAGRREDGYFKDSWMRDCERTSLHLRVDSSEGLGLFGFSFIWNTLEYYIVLPHLNPL